MRKKPIWYEDDQCVSELLHSVARRSDVGNTSKRLLDATNVDIPREHWFWGRGA